MAKKSTQSQAAKAVKKAVRKNPKGFIIAVIAIVLIIAIAVAVVYFAFPDTWNSIMSILNQEEQETTNNPPLIFGDGELNIHFLNVGQGDCIYIQFPDGKDMIIDCGNKSSGYNFNDTLSYLNSLNTDNTIDYLMLTHCDEDHVDSLDKIVDAYQINNIFMPNVLAAPTNTSLKEQVDALDTSMFTDPDTITTAVYAEFFIAALTEPNCTIKLNIDPDAAHNAIQIVEETYSLVFYCPTQETWDSHKLSTPHDKNAISPIGILSYNNRKIVLTGDANEEAWSEGAFIDRVGTIDCDVVKIGHHGSETSSSAEFLNCIKCEYAVISCNYYGNTFGHPRQAAIDRMTERNMSIYRTDLNGTIVLKIDKDSNLIWSTDRTATKAQLENGLSAKDISDIDLIKKDTSLSEKQKSEQIEEIVGYAQAA